MNSVLIPAGTIDQDELDSLVQQIASMKHADWEIEQQFVVTSDSPSLLAALEVLFTERPARANANGNGHKKTAKKRKAAAMKPRSWKNVLTGEVLSARALKGLMAQGLVSEQTAYENSRGEVFVVIGGELVKEPQGEKA